MRSTTPTDRSKAVPASIAEVVQDPDWLAHRYDPQFDAIHFVRVSRAMHHDATFLTDEWLPEGSQPVVLRREEVMAAAPAPAPLHFIFHSAYCCSTLLARAFDRPDWAMALKEPVILNDIVGWRRRGAPESSAMLVLDDALTLMARPFAPKEAVLVKPSTVGNGLAAPILALRPNSRAVLLYAPLRTYLQSIAKKGLDGRLWVRTMLAGMLDDNLADFGFTERDLMGQTDLQIAALGWLANHRLFADLIHRFGSSRVRSLDSGILMENPGLAIDQLAKLFELPLAPSARDEIIAGPAFKRHSKSGAAFDAIDRAAEHRAAADIYSEEIDKVMIWTKAFADALTIETNPIAPLIR